MMRCRFIRPLLVCATAVAISSTAIAPALSQSSSIFPGMSSSLSSQSPADEIIVHIPGYGHYPLSPNVQGAGLQPETATVDDLLSAAVFSADYEDNAVVRTAALRALTPERHDLVNAALFSLHSPVPRPAIAPLDAPIVVLGNGLNDDGSVHPNLTNRLESAHTLAISRPDAAIIVSGGPTHTGHVEAETMKDWLINEGISANRIMVEGNSTSTVSNARYSRALVPNATSVIVVTSENHVDRAVMNFVLTFGPHSIVSGVGAPNDPPTGMPSTLGAYRDALNWFLA